MRSPRMSASSMWCVDRMMVRPASRAEQRVHQTEDYKPKSSQTPPSRTLSVLQQQVPDPSTGIGVDAGCGLIQDHHLRPPNEG